MAVDERRVVVSEESRSATGSTTVGARLRRIGGRRGLPGGRAVVGGFLVALAALGVFAAYLDATSGPERRWVVAARTLQAGQTLVLEDLALASMDVPGELEGRLYADPEALVGATVLVPLERYDVLLASHLATERVTDPREVLSFGIDAASALGGSLQRGDRVDVIATYRGDGGASVVIVEDAEVLDAGQPDGLIGSAGRLTLTVAVAARSESLALAHAAASADLLVVRTTGLERDDTAPRRFQPDPTALLEQHDGGTGVAGTATARAAAASGPSVPTGDVSGRSGVTGGRR